MCFSDGPLEFDHIDPSTKLFNISSGRCVSYDRLVAEVKKCQLLCVKHHKDKTGRSPHGGAQKYKKGCRCQLCVSEKNRRQREYRRRRRNGEIGSHTGPLNQHA